MGSLSSAVEFTMRGHELKTRGTRANRGPGANTSEVSALIICTGINDAAKGFQSAAIVFNLSCVCYAVKLSAMLCSEFLCVPWFSCLNRLSDWPRNNT